jgi:hypothetical protein
MAKAKRKVPKQRKRPQSTRQSVNTEPVLVRGQATGAMRFVPAR